FSFSIRFMTYTTDTNVDIFSNAIWTRVLASVLVNYKHIQMYAKGKYGDLRPRTAEDMLDISRERAKNNLRSLKLVISSTYFWKNLQIQMLFIVLFGPLNTFTALFQQKLSIIEEGETYGIAYLPDCIIFFNGFSYLASLPIGIIKQIDKFRKNCMWRGSDLIDNKPALASWKMKIMSLEPNFFLEIALKEDHV
ncbi:hypothetical protein ACJX0J_031059, partial [Zea mays]